MPAPAFTLAAAPLLRDLLGIGLTLAAFTLLSAAIAVWRRRTDAHPELSRKFLHVGMGCVVLTFPWLFVRGRPWPVLAMGAAFLLLFFARRLFKTKALGRRLSALTDVLDGVNRSSGGEAYFIVSAAVLFAVSRGDPVLFCIPMLLLTLPDAVAALIGMRYGTHRYGPAGGEKSAEGSVAFFAVSFMAVHVPLLLANRTGRAETLLIAATLGLLVTLLEAIAWRGLDNLLVPLGGFILLKAFLDMNVPTLSGRLAVAGACVVFAIFWRRRTTLDGGAVLGAALVGYIAWALGGWRWLLPPLTVFVSYTLLWPKSARERLLAQNPHNAHNAHAVASVAAAGLLWLFAARLTDRVLDPATRIPGPFYYPYTLSFAAHLGLIGVARLCRRYPAMSAAALVAVNALAGWGLLFVPYLFVQDFTGPAFLAAALALPAVAAACYAFYATQPGIHDCPGDLPRWLRQAAYAAACSALGFALLAAGVAR